MAMTMTPQRNGHGNVRDFPPLHLFKRVERDHDIARTAWNALRKVLCKPTNLPSSNDAVDRGCTGDGTVVCPAEDKN
jgi:hypothetical protein